MANRTEKKNSNKPKNGNRRNESFVKKKKMQMKDLVLICIATAAILIGAWFAMSANSELKAYRDQSAALEEENSRLSARIESLSKQHATASGGEKGIGADQKEPDEKSYSKIMHIRNRNLVYPESYSIALEGFETDMEIDEDELIRELGDFGYERGMDLDSATYVRSIAINVPGMTAFTVSINGNEEEVINCICYEDGGMVMLYDESMLSSLDENIEKLAPTPTDTPSPQPTAAPATTASQNSRETTQTAQIEHIYDPETLSINEIPNGLYEAILDIDEMRVAIYQYMYANHIYDGEASIDEYYEVNGPYYDFKVIMSNDSRDIYVRYDSSSNRYFCGFNGF